MFTLSVFYYGRLEIKESFASRFEASRKIRALHLIGRDGWEYKIQYQPKT